MPYRHKGAISTPVVRRNSHYTTDDKKKVCRKCDKEVLNFIHARCQIEIMLCYLLAVSKTFNNFSKGSASGILAILSNGTFVCNRYLPEVPADTTLMNTF